MIFGAVGKSAVAKLKSDMHKPHATGLEPLCAMDSSSFLLFIRGENRSRRWISEDRSKALFLDGDLYNWDEFRSETKAVNPAQGLWDLYKKWGDSFLSRLNGDFVLVLWDGNTSTLLLAGDKIGTRSLYYTAMGSDLVFGSHPERISRYARESKMIDLPVLFKYLVFCYNPGIQTFFKGVYHLRSGVFIKWSDGRQSGGNYWKPSFHSNTILTEEDIAGEIRTRLGIAVKRRMRDKCATGAFLSGGLDSSSIVSLLHKQGQKEIPTFSFRCKGESFDESPYAKKVADFLKIEHHIIDYRPEDILLAEEMVQGMAEPFCDVGINIGTYLLARAAEDRATLLFTGDGGDELFAGHPVYIADTTARFFQKLPRFVRQGFFKFGKMLPDSDKKKDWKVKVKRFSESYAFPEALGTHRWRAYYLPDDLRRLLQPSVAELLDEDSLFGDMILYNKEADGPDALSRTLYSDYQTVVQFYLRRMELARRRGLQPRFPMLDPDLIEFCATIPSNLKIRGLSDTKYIERVAVEPLLPYDVVHRKDKLGHSVPLKNWMRENTVVKEFVFDLLSHETMRKRQWFNVNTIHKMKEEHINNKRNHSHRLWALVILELWMRSLEKKANPVPGLEESL